MNKVTMNDNGKLAYVISHSEYIQRKTQLTTGLGIDASEKLGAIVKELLETIVSLEDAAFQAGKEAVAEDINNISDWVIDGKDSPDPAGEKWSRYKGDAFTAIMDYIKPLLENNK